MGKPHHKKDFNKNKPINKKQNGRGGKQKIGLVFDENERTEYLKGNFQAKIKRTQNYKERMEKNKKEELRESRKQIREQKQEKIREFKELIEQNEEMLSKYEKKQKSTIKTQNNENIIVKTSFM